MKVNSVASNNIVILLSAYNGEKYIREQLESLLEQTQVNLTIYIRDDGSKDGTPQIIENYEQRYPSIVFINKGNRTNLGFSGSFLALMRYAFDHEPEAQYFEFCDQDDVWLPWKVERAYHLLTEEQKKQGCGNDIPAMYYSNKHWVDESLKKYGEDSFRNCLDDYMDVFFLPPVYGCTMMFNRKLGELTLAKKPPKELLYDVWMYRIACMVKSVIVADRKATILYRRHKDNASTGDCNKKFSALEHLSKLLMHKEEYHGMRTYLYEIQRRHEKLIQPEQKELIKLILTYDKSFKSRLKLLLWKRARIRGIRAYITWMGRVVLNAI